MEIKKRLKLNLQHFAEDPSEPKGDDTPTGDNVPEGSEESGESKPEGSEGEGEKRFTQAELDQIIADRLAREKRAQEKAEQEAADEAERKRLEEQGEYKTLLENAQQALAEKEAEIAARDRKDKIDTKLAAKGLSAEDVKRYAKYVEALAKDEDELDSVIEDVYSDYVVAKQESYGDPSAGFGDSKEPSPQGDDEIGRSLFKRIRGQGE